MWRPKAVSEEEWVQITHSSYIAQINRKKKNKFKGWLYSFLNSFVKLLICFLCKSEMSRSTSISCLCWSHDAFMGSSLLELCLGEQQPGAVNVHSFLKPCCHSEVARFDTYTYTKTCAVLGRDITCCLTRKSSNK